MLYYTALFLVIVLVSVIAVWMYRGIMGVARTAYNATMPSRRIISPQAKARLKSRQKARLKSAKVAVRTNHSSISDLPAKSYSRRVSSHGEVYKPGSTRVLWKGLSNRNGVSEPHISHSQSVPSQAAAQKNVGWPYKEEKMEFAGKAYKVKRKAVDGDFNDNGKPWVW